MADTRLVSITEFVYHYIPHKAPAGVAAAVFFVIGGIQLRHTFRGRSWWSLCLPIGSILYAVGFVLRIILTLSEENLDSLILFILTQLVIICAPAAFLAFNYILYGRLLAGRVRPEYSIMRPAIVSRVFIISDVTTFLTQATGGGLTAMEEMASAGKSILLFGLAAQLASYIIFWFMFTLLHIRASKAGDLQWPQPWHKILWVLHFSSACVVIRCVFRTAEWAVPSDHFLITKEWIFYVLDVVTLFFGVAVYCWWWPASYISSSQSIEDKRMRTDVESGVELVSPRSSSPRAGEYFVQSTA